MTIEQIDKAKVMIVLGTNDMKDFSLDYGTLSFKDPHSRRILSRLLSLACSKTGINTENKRMLVEALPHKSGCLILLTLKSKRRVYRVKKPDKRLCCIFDEVDCLMTAAALCDTDGGVYLYGDRYYLVTEDNVPLLSLARLEEFARCYVCSPIAAAKVCEAGKFVGEFKEMGKYF